MKILIGCLYFSNLTGSEVYYYEIAKTLINKGHEVYVTSSVIGGVVTTMAEDKGIKVTDINNIEDTHYDIIIASHIPIINSILSTKSNSKNWKGTKIISINHHEFYDVEMPVIHEDICHYIAIRPAIKDVLIQHGIDENKITLVWNPFDLTKFDKSKHTRANIFNINPSIEPYNRVEPFKILFCGTVDYIRKPAIYNIAENAMQSGDEVILLGSNTANYLQDLLNKYPNVTYIPETWDVEKYIHMCDATAGVFIGRTTIEGWLCGIPAIVYEMNPNLTINCVKYYPVPDNLNVFDENYAVERILECINK